MQVDNDIPNAPEEGQAQAGQVEQPKTEPEGSPASDAEARLAKLERDYKELQRDYTRKAMRLKEYERGAQVPQSQQQPVSEDFDWANPTQSLKRVVGESLAEFERRQEQKRIADQMIRDTAEQHGIPIKELQRYYQKLEESATDPYELMETVARMYRADHAEQAITEAKREAQQAAQRNARAVTTESGSPSVSPPGKSFEDMTGDEMRDYIKRVHGEREDY